MESSAERKLEIVLNIWYDDNGDSMISDVYLAAIPQDTEIGAVACAERQAYIEAATRENVRRERYFAWQLLEQALAQSFGISAPQFRRLPTKQWVCDGAFFSVAHTRGAVAAAVSDSAVGVDLENEAAFAARETEALRRKVCTEREAGDLIALWTKKEARFKQLGGEVFLPNQLDTNDFPSVTQTVFLPEKYVFSVCGALDALRIFEVTL